MVAPAEGPDLWSEQRLLQYELPAVAGRPPVHGDLQRSELVMRHRAGALLAQLPAAVVHEAVVKSSLEGLQPLSVVPHPVPQASAGRQHVQSLPAEDHHLVVVGESFEHPLGHVPELPQRRPIQRERPVTQHPSRELPVAPAVAELRPQDRLLQSVLAAKGGASPGRRFIDGLDLPIRHLAFGVPDEPGDARQHETAVNLLVEPDDSFPVHPRPIPRCHACHGPVDQQQIQRLPAQQGQLEAVPSPHAASYVLGALLLEAMLRVDVVEQLHDHLARQGQQAPQRREAQLPARRARELQGLRAQLSLRHGCLSWQRLLPRASLRSLRPSVPAVPSFFLPLSVRVGCLLRARRWRDAIRTQRQRGRSRAARHAARRRRAGPGSLRGGLLDFEFNSGARFGMI